MFTTVPGAPSSLVVDNTQQTSITLSWTPPDTPNGIVTQYEVQYSSSDSISFTSSNITDASTMTYTIEGLMPAVMYTVQLRAYTRVGAGPFISQTALTLTRKPLK